jgi:ribA/ribD-fused uncharacterized protein
MTEQNAVLPVPLPAIPDDNRVLYFERDRSAFGFMSHFWPSTIILDDESWPTVEHYYQAQKSFDPAYRAAIRAAEHPGRVKRLAAPPDAPRRISQQSWFRKTGNKPREEWNAVKLEVMRRADGAKYAQNAELAARLLATGEADLIEDSPHEPYWGIGADGMGENWAGRVLMEIRRALRQSDPGR